MSVFLLAFCLNLALFNDFLLNETCRDDEMLLTEKKWNIDDFTKWIKNFQAKVNELHR